MDGQTVMTIAEFMAWRYPSVHLTPEQLVELDERVAAVVRPANAPANAHTPESETESLQSATREHAADARASDPAD